jgi:sensor histidine kinase regulating citrate/malate metabolism
MTNMIIVENLSYRIRQHERAQVEKLAKQQYDNHLFSLRRIDNVNRKHHDLRHTIRGIEALDSIEEIKSSIKFIEIEIQNYELIFNTGNKILDISFSDRMQEEKEKNINLHVHADGQGWEIISDIDIATIFGNALDNAIESVEKGSSTNSRLIDVRTGKVNEMLIARFENQYSHQIEKTQSKFPSTKKDRDNHGYGLQSIDMIVSKYNGEMDIKTENGAFILTVIIPA